MVVLHDFKPCVDDELEVRQGQRVTLLYRENDWVYVIAGDNREGFIPNVYCVPIGSSVDDLRVHSKKPSSLTNNQTNNSNRYYDSSAPYIPGQLNRSSSLSLPSINTHILAHRNERERHTSQTDRSSNSDTPLLQYTDEPTYVNVDVQHFTKKHRGRYIVLFSFKAEEENDICVERGEFVTVLNKDDPDWFWISRSDQHEGFVPSKFLCPAEGQQSGQ